MREIVLPNPLRGPLIAVLSIALAFPPQTAFSQAQVQTTAPAVHAAPASEEIHSKYSEQAYAELKQLIESAASGDMDVAFFKKAYQFDHAADMMKLIFSDPRLAAKSNRLAELRKYYDWSIQAEFARDHFVVIENTNQGKANGARSDLDATANILGFDEATGKWGLKGQVEKLIEYQRQRYSRDGLKPEGVDVTLFNGDNFFADVRDGRLSVHQFKDSVIQTVETLRRQKGAYFVPGANKEQTHDRALAEGHTVHIGWDYVADLPSVNGRPFKFNPDKGEIHWLKRSADGKGYEFGGAVEELITREAAARGEVARYTGVEGLPPGERWRRALGNITQNMKEFFEPHDPVGRNKYFIERLIDQGAGRFTHLDPAAFDMIEEVPENLPEATRPPPTYVQIHEGNSPHREAWKKAYIQQAFGLANGNGRIAEIRKVLDRSADIQLDKTRNRASYADNAKFSAGNNYYYRDEWVDAVKNVDRRLSESGESKSPEAITALRELEAERLFVEKQARIIPEAAVQVVAETFRRDLNPPPGGGFIDREVRKKLMVERGVEIALLLDIVESSPLPEEERTALRQRVMDAVPKEVKDIVAEMADLAGLEMELAGRKGIGFEEHTGSGTASERWARVIEKLNGLYAKPSTVPEAAREALHRAVMRRLLPVEAEQFEKAWKSGKTALAAKFAGQAYWNEIVEQMDGIMVSSAAISLVQTYQQTCANQTNLSEACQVAMAKETATQVLFMLPLINSGAMITTGLNQISAGDYEGAVGVGLGVFSLPPVAAYLGATTGTIVHVYLLYQLVKGAYAVTFGYAEQRFKNDLVEQAFKAIREPGTPAGVPAKLFPSPTRSAVAPSLVPDFPLLSDVIGGDLVPADRMTEAQRTEAASRESALAIESELKELGLVPQSAAWQSKKRELATRYGMLLPYLQRMANIHKIFEPQVAARGAETPLVMPRCLADADQKIQQKYAEPPGMVARLRYWWSGDEARENERQNDLAAAWNECVAKQTEKDHDLLAPIFAEYVQTWLYAQKNYTTSPVGNGAPSVTIAPPDAVPLSASPRQSLNQPQLGSMGATPDTAAPADVPAAAAECDALTSQIRAAHSTGDRTNANRLAASAAQKKCFLAIPSANVEDLRNALMREYVVHRYMDQQESGRQMKNALASAQDQSKTKLDLMAKELDRRKELTKQLGEQLRQSNSESAAGDQTRSFTLRGPPYAIAAGDTALFDVSTRVLSSVDATAPDKTPWKVDLDGRVTKVSLGAPDNIIVTPELRRELTPQAGKSPKRLVTFEETVTAQLKNPSGAAVATAQTTATVYGLIEWQGSVGVEVRSAGPDTKDPGDSKQTSLYAFAPVKLTGQVQAQQESAALDLPQPGEAYFTPLPEGRYTIHAEPRAMDKTHKPAEAVVDLTGVSTGRTDTGEPAIVVGDEVKFVTIVLPYSAPPQTAPQPPGSQPPSRPPVNLPPVGAGRSADTDASGNTPPATPNTDIVKAQERAREIQKLREAAQRQSGSCDYAAALASLQELANLDPDNAALADLPRVERWASVQTSLRNLLLDAAHPATDAEARELLAELRQMQPDAPPCMAGEVSSRIASLERRLAALGRVTAALAACEYVKALAAARELQALAPDDDWLAANLGQVQAAAAAQSNALTLISQATPAPASPEAATLAARLRQSLAAAPACMAGQIQNAIDTLERGQRPSFLDTNSQPATQTSGDDSLNRARRILEQTAQDETARQAQEAARQAQEAERQRLQAERQRLTDEELQLQQQRDRLAREAEEAARRQRAEENAARRRAAAERAQAALGNILTALGGQMPGNPVSSGAAAQDPFEGIWSCRGRITSQRNANVRVNNPESVVRIRRDGSGYILDSNSGPIPSTSVSGNHITFSARVGRSTSWAANTTEFTVNANRASGTEQMTNSDGLFVTASEECVRQ